MQGQPSGLKLVGAPGSPYSRKMRSVLRYRRIPFRWIVRRSKDDRDIPDVPVALIPVLVFPQGDAMIDSSFQIQRLEREYDERCLTHPDPALAFLDALIEDFADEWLTKAMYHYRWAYPKDAANAAAILPRWSRIDAAEAAVAPLSKAFAERQVGRLAVVGSNETTGPIIEESFRRTLRGLDACLSRQPFVMGGRPGAADFALFGQLSQLVFFDPTSAAVAREESPRVVAWCEVLEDLSGYEVADGDWLSREAARESLQGLLVEAGRCYVPFLLANAAALERGEAQLECRIDAQRWVQRPFPYQQKCLAWLREAHAALSATDRVFVAQVMEGSGCERLFDV